MDARSPFITVGLNYSVVTPLDNYSKCIYDLSINFIVIYMSKGSQYLEIKIDYPHLRDLLVAGKWYEADQETRLFVLKAANCEKKGYLNSEDWRKFPGSDLCTIDRLWVDHSNGHFGFSVQKQIWQNIGGKPDADWNIIENFCDQVDWKRDGNWLHEKDLQFSLTAKKGHLPCDPITHYSGDSCGVGLVRWWVFVGGICGWSLFSREDF